MSTAMKRAFYCAAILCALGYCTASLFAQNNGDKVQEEIQPSRLVTSSDTSQPEIHPNLRMVTRSYADSVVIRWGTVDHITWKVAGHAGYILERLELSRTEKPVWTRLTPTPLVPLPLDEWKARYRAEDTLIGAAVQTWYGKPVVTSDDPFGSIYEMYIQQKNLHGFALLLADIDPRIADGLALRFVDRSVTPGKAYLYRVYSVANNPDRQIDTALVAANAVAGEPIGSVQTLRAQEAEKLVVLQWERYEHPLPMSGYYIEQSTDGGKTFVRRESIPFVPAVNPDADAGAQDTIEYRIEVPENYRPVQYRVVGINAFGETSPNSSIVTAMGRDRTAPKAPLPDPYEIVDGVSLRLQWHLNGNPEPDLGGFIVAKSEDPEGPFMQISTVLPASTRSYIDTNVRDLPQHYYVISALDTAGNMRASVPVLGMFPDSIPPVVPSGFAGRIDSNGVVTLTWNANKEPDLKGYRVFFANQDDHEYMQLTTTITTDTVYVDTLTLETLSEDIYYKITALDENFNHSPFTAPLKLKKPDIVAPASPLITEVTADDKTVRLAWYQSPSSDVVAHTLLRRKEGAQQWTELTSARGTAFTMYTDSTAERELLYEYAVTATDDDGLRSPVSNIVTGRVYDNGIRPAVERLAYNIDTTNNRIVLRWTYPAGSNDEVYLYRATGKSELVLYHAVPVAAKEFTDVGVETGGTYRYGIKVVSSDGGESPMATTELIELKRNK